MLSRDDKTDFDLGSQVEFLQCAAAVKLRRPTKISTPSREYMFVEALSTQSAEQFDKSKGESLDTTYSLTNEVRFLHRHSHLTPHQQHYYLTQQMYKFLDEHAGRIPYSRIPGRLTREGQLEFCGVDMDKSWQNAIANSGNDSRVICEVEGYRRAQEMLKRGANAVVISSPQKPNVDRRFTFILTKDSNKYEQTIDGIPISQLCILHEGSDLSLQEAKHQYSALEFLAHITNHKAYTFSSENEMLVEPIPFESFGPNQVDEILRSLHIGSDDIAASHRFQKVVESELSDDINAFAAIIQELATFKEPIIGGGHFAEVKTLLRKAKKYHDGIFNAAQIIRQRLDGKINTHVMKEFFMTNPTSTEERMAFFSAVMKATIQGGVSCPAVQKTSRSPFKVSEDLSRGKTIIDIINDAAGEFSNLTDKKFECPRCGEKAEGKVGDTCPHCHLTKDEAEKLGYTIC